VSGKLRIERQFCSARVSGGDDKDEDKDEVEVILDDDVPESYYDEEIESRKEFLDLAQSLRLGGIDKLTALVEDADESKLEGSSDDNEDEDGSYEYTSDEDDDVDHDDFKDYFDLVDGDIVTKKKNKKVYLDDTEMYGRTDEIMDQEDERIIDDIFELVSYKDEEFEANIDIIGGEDGEDVIHEDQIDHNQQFSNENEESDPLLDEFKSDSSHLTNSHYNQGERECPGKLQRHGKTSQLRCHLIDLDGLNYYDILTLRKFLSDDGEIMGKRLTGLCSKCQRKVAKTIKASRNFGFLPHIGDYTILEAQPNVYKKKFHDKGSPLDTSRVVSRTIL